MIALCHHVFAENGIAFKLGAGGAIEWWACIGSRWQDIS